jgi:transcriptional regulator with XRE-family HTH domain
LAKQKPTRKKIESPFARNLDAILKERNIAQKTAAAMAEVTSATMSDWCSGNSLPHDLMKVEKLCRALGCDFQWLLTGVHSRTDLQTISMSELFESEEDPMFSGVFEISARRLRRKKKE